MYLGLELLVLVLLVVLVVGYLPLGLIASLTNALGADWMVMRIRWTRREIVGVGIAYTLGLLSLC